MMETTPIPSPLERLFVDDATLPWETVAEGVSRKIMTYDANLMLVKVQFETGGIGATHQHHHTQISYVVSGEFNITIADETRTVRTGDAYYIPPNVLHGAVCVQAGTLVDVFTPLREDFI